MINYDKLPAYRPGPRPVTPESLPAHIDRELNRLRDVISAQAEALKDLNVRIAASGH